MHATTNFPAVNRVVYSTCSLYVQENEKVIQRVLDATNGDWELVTPRCLSNFGMIWLTGEQSQCLIRVDPDEDHATTAFFCGVTNL
jgi:16S rRNA C967 or C1407 C5-methylase (RsmB/RsmF family)